MRIDKMKGGLVHWYPLIKDYTPSSQYIKVSDDDFRLFLAQVYDLILEGDPLMQEMHDRPKTGLTREGEANRLNEIAQELDLLFEGSAKFFRTDIFSPKDAGNCIVESGEAAIRLLCQSYRFYNHAPILKRDDGLCLVLRDVVIFLEEYRVFVTNGAVIGISQGVDSDVANYELTLDSDEKFFVDDGKMIQIRSYVEGVLKSSGITEGVLDVGVTDENQLMIVECNPFSIKTDKCLLAKYSMYEEFPYDYVTAYQINGDSVLYKEYKGEQCHSRQLLLQYDSKMEFYGANPDKNPFLLKCDFIHVN